MENYIVRIYRRDNDNPQNIAGVVEFVGADCKKTFTTFDELNTLLTPEKKIQDASKNTGSRKYVMHCGEKG